MTSRELRAALLKQRDAQVARPLIVIRARRANRAAVASAADVIGLSFPLGTRAVLNALRAGRDPGANGLVLVRADAAAWVRPSALHRMEVPDTGRRLDVRALQWTQGPDNEGRISRSR